MSQPPTPDDVALDPSTLPSSSSTLRSLAYAGGLVALLGGGAIASLLAGRGIGALEEGRRLLALCLLQTLWLTLGLPFVVAPGGDAASPGARSDRLRAGLGALVLGAPLLLFVARLDGGGGRFLVEAEALAGLLVLACVPLAGGRGGAYLAGLLVLLVGGPWLAQAAGDLLGWRAGGPLRALSPTAALLDGYPGGLPGAALGACGAAAILAWSLPGVRPAARPAALAALLFLPLTLASGSPAAAPADGDDDLRLVSIRSSLEGRFRAGGHDRLVLEWENGTEGRLDGVLEVRVDGIEHRMGIALGPGERAGAAMLVRLGHERPGFLVRLQTASGAVALPAAARRLDEHFVPVPPEESLMGWIGGLPAGLEAMLRRLSAARVAVPDDVAADASLLEAVDLLIVARPVGERLAGAIRDWQAHGGTVLSLSAEASVELGAPLPDAPGDLSVRARGAGLLATMDLAGDRTLLFERARSELRLDRPRRGRRPEPGVETFGRPALGGPGRRRAIGWLLGYATLALVATGWSGRRWRPLAQGLLAVGAVATMGAFQPASVLSEEVAILSGSAGSSTFGVTRVVRLAGRAAWSRIALPGDDLLPRGAGEGFVRDARRGWTLELRRGQERALRGRGTVTLGGAVHVEEPRGDAGPVVVVNDTGEDLRGAVLLEGAEGTYIGDVPAGGSVERERAVDGTRGRAKALRRAMDGAGSPVVGRLLRTAAGGEGARLVARLAPYPAGAGVPGCEPSDPHESVVVIHLR